jgi:pimeloyl-ACP methyl ester carboxylesterase
MKPPAVLVSGQLLTEEFWQPVVSALGGSVSFSHADHARDDSIAGMAARLLSEAPPVFDLIAHAMGGFVAFEVMRTAPERVRRLALLSTLAPNDGPAQIERRQGYARLVEAGQFERVVEERVPILLHPARQSEEALLTPLRRMAAETGAETFLRQQRAIIGRADSRPSLAQIACPTLLVRGDSDGIVSAAHQDEMLAAIPDVRLETIPDCGHIVTLERPDETVAILRAWLGV